MNQLIIDDAVERVRVSLEAGKLDDAIAYLNSLHPADRAETFSELEREDQQDLLPRLSPESTAEILEELEDDEAAEVASELPAEQLADVLDEMDPDLAADVLGDLPPEQADAALRHMEEADDVRPLLAYGDETAGGLMTPEFFALRGTMTAAQALAFVRQQDPEGEAPYYLYVVDSDDKLFGVVGLRALIGAAPDTHIEQIMHRDLRTVPVGTDQEEVANLMTKYSLIALPVVDAAGKLVGVISSSDIANVIEDEATEDIYRLSNVSDGDLTVWSPVKVSVSRRLPWLFLNMGTAFLAASVVNAFQYTIAQLAVLAAFQSIVAGQGGNAGTQTLAIMVRGLALGEIELRDIGPALLREIGIGALHGLAIGLAVGLIAWVWQGIPVLGLVIGLAMLGNLLAAAAAGTLVPLTLKALKLDPALASAVLVTTVTDCVGFALFLGLATAFLPLLHT
jgi:magnesium transporter